MQLPSEFLSRMQRLLGPEYPAFLNSFTLERTQGLRVNPLKCTPQDFMARKLFDLQPVPWCAEGFYYQSTDRPGKHPLYEAGVYYIQEPSAMAVGALASAKPGEWVLDLCAAPGGKTTHLAGDMQGSGLLVANEIHPGRAKILSQSVERAGITNAVVTNESPDRLAQRFPHCFDCVVVDAPCSGEGMFRKDETAVREWTPEAQAFCAARQDQILDKAADMLRPGGRLVYSTCTFAPEENEGALSRLLARRSELSIQCVERFPWFSPGRPDWVKDGNPQAAYAFRLWPHHVRGEGHFCALLRANSDGERARASAAQALPSHSVPVQWKNFKDSFLTGQMQGRLARHGDHLWLLPEEMPDLSGMRTLRTGVQLGVIKKDRFEPAHAFALACPANSVRQTVNFASDSPQALRYLKGEALAVQGGAGWSLVTVDGFALGWGKISGGQIKNHYPKGIRWK